MRVRPSWGPCLAIALAVLGVVAPLASAGALLRPGATSGAPGPSHPSSVAAPAGPGSAALPAGRPIPRNPAIAGGVGGGQAEIRVDAADPLAVPNSGLEMNLTGYPAPVLPLSCSFEVSAVDTVGGYQAVFGLFQNNTLVPTPFFAVFSNTTDQLLALHYWFGFAVNPGVGYEFALRLGAGTNWSLTVNGVPFDDNTSENTFDFGTHQATWAAGISFSELALYGESPPLPPNITASLDFATLRASGWYLPTLARASNIGSVGRAWGIEGNLQHPTLAPGETVSGVDIAPVLNGTSLWSGGPDSVSVSAQAAKTVIPSLGATLLTVQVTGPAGGLPGVAISFGGGAGGDFLPDPVLTNPTGGATTQFLAANVTSLTSTSLVATVTTFGYRGNASVPVSVSASIEVFLHAAANVTVVAASTTGIAFTAVTANGSLIPNLVVAFATTGVGGVSPTAGETDGTGVVTVDLLAPGSVSNLIVRATVADAGYWGGARVGVHVAPRPSPGTSLASLLELAGGLAAAGGAIALLVRYRRRRAKPLPLPPLPRLRADPPGATPGDPANRRPPASGSP